MEAAMEVGKLKNDAKKYLNLAKKDMATKTQAGFWLEKANEKK